MLPHTLGVKTAAKIITAVNCVQCYIHIIHFELLTEAIEDQSNIIYSNCKESHSEVMLVFFFRFFISDHMR